MSDHAPPVFPLRSFTFGLKDAKPSKDRTVQDRLLRMRSKYQAEGPRRSVEGIVLAHDHGQPHVLLLQSQSEPPFFKLPGGRLKPGEDEFAGLMRKMSSKLSPDVEEMVISWGVGPCIATFYRPNFETLMYPYLPPHITKPKEVKRLYVVGLPEKASLAVPQNFTLVAIPLFELHDNVVRYGPIISSLPTLLSRLRLNLENLEETKPALLLGNGQA